MKNRTRNSRSSGFTLVEVLATAGILVILLAIAMVGVIRYIDVLKIAELDNAARDIYMAAENRAVLLHSAQRLDDLVDSTHTVTGADGKTLHYVSRGELYDESANTYSDLLAYGNIDPTLYNGDFYIVYDLDSGGVSEVFYAEKAGALENLIETVYGGSAEFPDFYSDTWSGSTRSQRLEWKNEKNAKQYSEKTLVGRYNGEAAQGSTKETDIQEKPYIDVVIVNKEELTVTVTVKWDSSIDSAVQNAITMGKLSVKLVGTEIDLFRDYGNGNARNRGGDDLIAGRYVYSRTWVLDSLAKAADGSSLQFKDLFQQADGTYVFPTDVTPGADFIVKATIEPVSTAIKDSFIDASATATNNSLFEYKPGGASNGTTAHIAYLRHLQNLSNTDASGYNSGVGTSKTSAVQTAHIWGDGNGGVESDTGNHKPFVVYQDGNPVAVADYSNYKFVPIENTSLTSYSGFDTYQDSTHANPVFQYEIRNLDLLARSACDVGLFAKTYLDDSGTMELIHIRLVNTTMTERLDLSTPAASVGALVGRVSFNGGGTTKITDCWVYWNDLTRLTSGPGSVVAGTANVKYQLKGNVVGGLVGIAQGDTEITGSLAATLIEGYPTGGRLAQRYAGGLVGATTQVYDDVNSEFITPTVTINNSYADCYLCRSANIAGLVGHLSPGSTANLTNCYAAGFIMDPGNATTAGLCLGDGTTTTATNVYSAMVLLSGEGYEAPANALTAGTLSGTAYYLNKSTSADGGMTYADMTNQTASGFISKLGGSTGSFEQKGDAAASDNTYTRPYYLETYLRNRTDKPVAYEYPGLKGLPHYGDWGTLREADVFFEKLPHFLEDGSVLFTVETTNNSGFDLYGLYILDVMSITEGSGIELTFSNYRVKIDDGAEQEIEPIYGGEHDFVHVFKVFGRDEVFADGATVILSYTVKMTKPDGGKVDYTEWQNDAYRWFWTYEPNGPDKTITVTFTDGMGGWIFPQEFYPDVVARESLEEREQGEYNYLDLFSGGTPAHNGYKFTGWKSEVVDGNVIYTAQWLPLSLPMKKTFAESDITADGFLKDGMVHFTVTVTNSSGYDLYGLYVYDEMTVKEGSGIELAFSDYHVEFSDGRAGYDIEPVYGGPNDFVHLFKLLARDEVFKNGLTVTLTYTVEMTKADGGKISTDEWDNIAYRWFWTNEEDGPGKTITVTFIDGVGGWVFPGEVHLGVKVRESNYYEDLFEGPGKNGIIPERPGHRFICWDRLDDDENGNVTYTAHWHHVIEDTWNATKKLRGDQIEFKRKDTISWNVTIENPSEYDRYVSAAETLEGAKLTTQDGEPISEDDTILVKAGETVTLIATYVVSDDHELGKVINVVTVKGMGSCPDHPEEDGTTHSATNNDASVVTDYTLYYDANGGDEESVPEEQSEDETEEKSWTFDISSDVPTREGYKFLGWSEDPDADEPGYQPGGEITIYDPDTEVTLYAVWAKNITVTFKDGVNGSVFDDEVHKDVAVRENSDYTDLWSSSNPTRTGYTFIGWSKPSVDEDGNVTYTAIWQKRNATVRNGTVEDGQSEDGTNVFYRTITVTNDSDFDIYGLNIFEVIRYTLTKLDENQPGEPSVELTVSDWRVNGEPIEPYFYHEYYDGDPDPYYENEPFKPVIEQEFWIVGRNVVFEAHKTYELTYTITAKDTGQVGYNINVSIQTWYDSWTIPEKPSTVLFAEFNALTAPNDGATDPDPLESEPKEPGQTEIEIQELEEPEEQEEQAKDPVPEPEQAALPPKSKYPEADGSDPDPEEGPET